jgi:ParB family chromosome partitioning protein
MTKKPQAVNRTALAAAAAAAAAMSGEMDDSAAPAVMTAPPPTSAAWSDLHPSPLNPRKSFDEEALAGLANSIEAEGIHIPLLVRRINQPGNTPVPGTSNPWGACDGDFEIIGGERRHRAFGLLVSGGTHEAEDHLPIKLLDPCDDARFLEIVLTENIARRDMTPIEEAKLFAQLVENGRSTATIGQIAGIGQRAVQKRIKLLKDLQPGILLELEAGRLTVEHANVLASQCPMDEQGEVMQMIRDGRFGSADEMEVYLRHRRQPVGPITAPEIEEESRCAEIAPMTGSGNAQDASGSGFPSDMKTDDLLDRMESGARIDRNVSQVIRDSLGLAELPRLADVLVDDLGYRSDEHSLWCDLEAAFDIGITPSEWDACTTVIEVMTLIGRKLDAKQAVLAQMTAAPAPADSQEVPAFVRRDSPPPAPTVSDLVKPGMYVKNSYNTQTYLVLCVTGPHGDLGYTLNGRRLDDHGEPITGPMGRVFWNGMDVVEGKLSTSLGNFFDIVPKPTGAAPAEPPKFEPLMARLPRWDAPLRLVYEEIDQRLLERLAAALSDRHDLLGPCRYNEFGIAAGGESLSFHVENGEATRSAFSDGVANYAYSCVSKSRAEAVIRRWLAIAERSPRLGFARLGTGWNLESAVSDGNGRPLSLIVIHEDTKQRMVLSPTQRDIEDATTDDQAVQ